MEKTQGLTHFLSAEPQRSPDLTHPIVEMGKLRLKVPQNLLSAPSSVSTFIYVYGSSGGKDDDRNENKGGKFLGSLP